MPVSIGSTRCPGAGPAPFFACVRCALAVLFVIGGSLGPGWGTVCLGRRDSHADQGAVATQFSSSTGAGTSPPSAARLITIEIPKSWGRFVGVADRQMYFEATDGTIRRTQPATCIACA